jgi:hypothetical protein
LRLAASALRQQSRLPKGSGFSPELHPIHRKLPRIPNKSPFSGDVQICQRAYAYTGPV